MKIHLIDGAQNTFALVSYLGDSNYVELEILYKNKIQLSKIAKIICKHPSIKVDGCVFVFPQKDLDFAWEFFNSDGSDALMCGNAARAVAFWYSQFVNNKKLINYYTPSQNVKAEILSSLGSIQSNTKDVFYPVSGAVKVWLKPTKFIAEDEGHRIYNSGVPHLCVHVKNVDLKDTSFQSVKDKYFDKARSLRFPKALDSKGSNVTYVWQDPDDLLKIKAISFERGVENWTQACGTGAMAAAYFANDYLDMKFPINVQMPGGVLEINEFEGQTSLSGPAQIYKILNIDI